MSVESPATPAPESSSPGPMDLNQAVWQLRTLVCGLGAALLVLSLTFNAFVIKQNRNVVAMTNIRVQQAARQEQGVTDLTKFVNVLANYGADKPELSAIFTRYGLQLKPSEPPAAPPNP